MNAHVLIVSVVLAALSFAIPRPAFAQTEALALFAPTSAQTGAPFSVVFSETPSAGGAVFFAAPGTGWPVAGEFNSLADLDHSPVELFAPFRPGDYDLIYTLADGNVAARLPVTVEPATAVLSAPAEISAGSDVPVFWRGPAGPLDAISFAQTGTGIEGVIPAQLGLDAPNPVILQAPSTPGTYQLRYVQNVVGLEFILARIDIRVR